MLGSLRAAQGASCYGPAYEFALILDTENKRFTLDIEKDRLDNAPGFDKDHWPDMADSTWRELIHSYYSNKTF